MAVAVLIIVLVTTVWVGIDASARDWSKVEGAGPHSTGGWIAFCLLLWIGAFPRYLWLRTRAPNRSELTAAEGRTSVKGEAPAAGAGWYQDPTGSTRLRWWDGSRWTEHTAA
jgi:Protein of unknown function (DUF2510)